LIRLAEPGAGATGSRGIYRATAASRDGDAPIGSGEQQIIATTEVAFALVS
jgi:hypothetical protein